MFEVFSQRYECASTMVTSNLPLFDDGPKPSAQTTSQALSLAN
ncbi:MAG: hypothetical protein V3U57_05535 [Robiginitomaculum sp.]